MGWIEDLNRNVNQGFKQGITDFNKNANQFARDPLGQFGNFMRDADKNAGKANRERLERKGNATRRQPEIPSDRRRNVYSADKASSLETTMRPSPNRADYDDGVRNPIKSETAQVEKSALEKFQDYLQTIDPGDYDYKKAVTDAFAKAYANIDNAAKTAKDNKTASASAIAGLAQGGANIVKGESKDYQRITDNTANTNNTIYQGAVSGLQQDRSKELADRAQFLERLGIKEAGLGTAGSTQTSAINEALGSQTRNADRINAYGQADQALNTSRAQSILNEGTTRQAGLESQLQKILGSLEDKRTDYGMQEAQALSQAEQAAYANQMEKFKAGLGAYQQQIDNDFKSRDQQMQEAEFMAKYGNGGGQDQGQILSQTGSQAADAYAESQGVDTGQYRSFMTNFARELANDPNVRTNQVNPELIRGRMLEEAMKLGLDPNIVNVMFEYERKAPVKYMDQ